MSAVLEQTLAVLPFFFTGCPTPAASLALWPQTLVLNVLPTAVVLEEAP